MRRAGSRVGLAAITSYQVMRSGKPSPCRYYPSCSAYAAEAVEVHGLLRGSLLAARRVLRCNPFTSRHGIDLVPIKTAPSRRTR